MRLNFTKFPSCTIFYLLAGRKLIVLIMNKRDLMALISRSSRYCIHLKGQAHLSTSTRVFGESELWGQIATGQEMKSNVTQTRVSKITSNQEKDEAEMKIQQLQNLIRESEHKLTGLQRMKYKKDDYEKEDYVLTKLRTMRNQTVKDPHLRYGLNTAAVSQGTTSWNQRMVKTFGDAITCAAFAVICYGLYTFFNKVVKDQEEKDAQKQLAAAGVPVETNQFSLADSSEGVVTHSKESSESIFE